MNEQDRSFGIEDEFGFVPRFTLRGEPVSLDRLMSALTSTNSLTLDYSAINVFMRTEFYLNGQTPFEELRRAYPPPVIVEPREISRAAALDEFISLFQQAVRRRISSGNTVALSGGRDSRHILLELTRQNAPGLHAISVDLEMNEDAAIAHALAERLGVAHTVVPPSRTIADAEFTVPATGFLSMEHAWMAAVARSRNRSAWWDGIGGDVLSNGHFLTDWNVRLFADGRLEELSDRIVARGKIPYFRDQSLFPRQAAVEAVYEELVRHVGAANPVGSFYLWNRTRGNVAPSAFGLLRIEGSTTHAPFLDRDLWMFLSSVPVSMFINHDFHSEAIRRAYPDCSDIPFANRKVIDPQAQRSAALQLLSALIRRRPSMPNLDTALRVIRCLVSKKRLNDIDWVFPSWVYGDQVTRAAVRR